ncbi:MAG TPA: acriflavin resistance protein, partial [Ruminococcaceae bacterium]|nr:acriflavin resistance protein [Oscillospiraceae bacterium]
MAYSLLASLIVALTLVPSLSSRMLRKFKNKEYRYFGRFAGGYKKTLNWVLNKKILTLAVCVLLLIGSSVMLLARGASFIPSMDMGELTVEYELPEDIEMDDAKKLADTVVERVEGIEEIETIGAMMSSGGMMSLMGTGMGPAGEPTSTMLYIRLREDISRSEAEINADIMERLSDLEIDPVVSGAAMMDMSALGGSGVSVEIYGNDLDDLRQTASDVADVLETVEGTKNVSDGMEDNEPEIRFVIDKEKAMKEGLTVAQVYQEISAALSSEKDSTSVTYDGDNYDVIVLSGEAEELTPEFIENHEIDVTTREGEQKKVALRNIAKIERTETLSAINRSGQRRFLTVTAEIADGYNVSLVAADAREKLEDETLPEGTSFQFTGENESINDSMGELGKMLLLGLLLIYLIMVAQFQSLKSPFIVMFTIPLAFTGGFMALLITGKDFSIIAMIGLIMLCGIIVNNGIVLVDYINQLRHEGIPKREAILQAGVTRMRPILMTSLTTIMGLMVMALGVGDGGEMMQPLAIVSVGGMVFATMLTMYVIPVMYDAFFRKDKIRRIEDELKEPDKTEPEKPETEKEPI